MSQGKICEQFRHFKEVQMSTASDKCPEHFSASKGKVVPVLFF
jgi:hypothetical protein